MRGGGADFAPDVEALKASGTRIVVAVGEESGGPVDGEMAGRAGYAVAALLGRDVSCSPADTRGSVAASSARPAGPSNSRQRCVPSWIDQVSDVGAMDDASSTVIVTPPPGVSDTETDPPIASTKPRTTDSPRPMPVVLSVSPRR